MKKIFLFLVVLALLPVRGFAYFYDFSYTYQGQTLYYRIVGNDEVMVVPEYQYQDDEDPFFLNQAAYANLSGALTIPESVTYNGVSYTVIEIGADAFNRCSNLTSVTIPNSVTAIASEAFLLCSGLTSLTIPNSVTHIGDHAFRQCGGLMEIHTLAEMAPTLGMNAFLGVPNTIPVYVPCGREAHYYSQWSYFSNIIEETNFTFSAESADDNMGVVQILTMPTCTAPNAVLYAVSNSGYRFDHWSTGSTSNPYTLTVTGDTVITAYFVSEGGGTEGIDDVDESDIQIHAECGSIVVNGIENENVQVFNMVGRPVGTHALPTGVYFVKIGNHSARKIVVVR